MSPGQKDELQEGRHARGTAACRRPRLRPAQANRSRPSSPPRHIVCPFSGWPQTVVNQPLFPLLLAVPLQVQQRVRSARRRGLHRDGAPGCSAACSCSPSCLPSCLPIRRLRGRAIAVTGGAAPSPTFPPLSKPNLFPLKTIHPSSPFQPPLHPTPPPSYGNLSPAFSCGLRFQNVSSENIAGQAQGRGWVGGEWPARQQRCRAAPQAPRRPAFCTLCRRRGQLTVLLPRHRGD